MKYCEKSRDNEVRKAVPMVLMADSEKKNVWGKRYGARSCGPLVSRRFGFLSLQNARTIEPTTAWTVVSSTSEAPGTRCSTIEWTGARPIGEQWFGFGPMSISSGTGPPSSGDYFRCLREKSVGPSEVRTRDLSALSHTLCRCASSA